MSVIAEYVYRAFME